MDFEFQYNGEKRILYFIINGKKADCDFRVIKFDGKFIDCHYHYLLGVIAKNDSLGIIDFMDWFHYPRFRKFKGQIICWSDQVNY